MGLPWRLRTTTLGMAHTLVSEWWKAMKPAAGQGTNQPYLGLPTKTNELSDSINILLCLALALRESCVHCVTHVIHPSTITLFTNQCQVQLMREVLRKPMIPFTVSHFYRNQNRGGCTLWGCANVIETFGFWTGTVKRLYWERKLRRLSKTGHCITIELLVVIP